MLSCFRDRLAALLGIALLLAAPAHTLGQVPPPAAPPAGTMIDTTGTVEAISPEFMLQIKSATGQVYVLQLTQNSKLQVTGTAKADVLGPGNFISFVADVDKRRGTVQNKVEKLILFTPSVERPLGAFPSQGGVEGPLSPDPFAAAEPGGAKPASRKRTRNTEDTGPAVESFEIVGQIAGVDKRGKLTVHAPNNYFRPAVQVELGDDPKIELDLTGVMMYTLAKPGDKVKVRGKTVGQELGPNVVEVAEATITLVEPFTTVQAEEPKKKPPRKTTRSSRRKRGEPEEAEEPEKTDAPEKAADAEKDDEPKKADSPEKDDAPKKADAPKKDDDAEKDDEPKKADKAEKTDEPKPKDE
ncbi:MAG: hypothetical protein ABIK89_15715 [Planctomycetota bacterium]